MNKAPIIRLLLVTFIILLFGCFFSSVSIADAPINGNWTVVGSMALPRYSSAEVLLQDGRALVAEGSQMPCTGPLDLTAEIYDPATKLWSPTGNLLLGRLTNVQNLVTLQNGKVLVGGGIDVCSTSTIGESELYDPSTGLWSVTGSLNMPRAGAGMIVLNDGRVLAAGGYIVAGPNLNTAEIYDPNTGVWSYTGSMSSTHGLARMVKLQDGRVLIAGGYGGPDSAEIYDPATGTWSPAGTMPYTWNESASLTLMQDGRVFLAGGSYAGQILANAAIYDPATNTWLPVAPLPYPRVAHYAFLLSDGRVLLGGGAGGPAPQKVLSDSVIYDPVTNAYVNGSSLNSPRWSYTQGVSLTDGNVVIEGGISDANNTTLSSAELYAAIPPPTPTLTNTPTPTPTPACTWSGFLQPINSNGSSIFKLNSTVSVKAQLTGVCAGLTNATLSLYLAKVTDNVIGTDMEADSTSAADSGNIFRYDPSSNQYIFNLGTKSLTTGTYQLSVYYGGTNVTGSLLGTVKISLK